MVDSMQVYIEKLDDDPTSTRVILIVDDEDEGDDAVFQNVKMESVKEFLTLIIGIAQSDWKKASLTENEARGYVEKLVMTTEQFLLEQFNVDKEKLPAGAWDLITAGGESYMNGIIAAIIHKRS